MNWDKARGVYVWSEGKRYLDFTSSIFTQNFGHSNPYVIRNVRKQIGKCLHTFDYGSKYKNEFESRIKDFTGYDQHLVLTTGSEATEAAIKLCINNGYRCIGVKGSMHGRTHGSEALVGKRNIPIITTVESVAEIGTPEPVAIFIEAYRGYDVMRLTDDEVKNLRRLQKYGCIIVFDEIQSGFYRTDKCFAYQSYDIKPDILLIGKAIAGGMPVSVVCYSDEFTLKGMEYTTTHSGGPVQMAAACGILDFIKRKFNYAEYYHNCEEINLFTRSLRNLGVAARNFGMVGAIKTNNEKRFYDYCKENGVLVVETGKGWIKFAPPVVIKRRQLGEGLIVIFQAALYG